MSRLLQNYCFEERFERRSYDISAVNTGQYKPTISHNKPIKFFYFVNTAFDSTTRLIMNNTI